MHILDWIIVLGTILGTGFVALSTKRYVHSVSDFLAAGRCAKRYLLCVSSGMASVGAVSIIAMFEMYYSAGFTASWWMLMMSPVLMLITISGWVSYRYRETRVFTMAQLFELRYTKGVRIYAGILAWVSGMINFGIFPAVAARFFVYYCGLPETIGFLGISTYSFIVVLLVLIALCFVFQGGQITVMVTDFFQGAFTNIALLILLGYFFVVFDWSNLIVVLKRAPENASMLNPYKTGQVADFNVFYFVIGAVSLFYVRNAWQGAQGFACSAKNAHEAKMGNILGEWRGLIMQLLLVLLPLGAYLVMNDANWSTTAQQVNDKLQSIENPTLSKQLMVPVVMSKVLPTGLIGLFAAIMLTACISTQNTYMHSWGSIFVQDVILPFRKTPFSKETHFLLLRASIVFVAIFIIIFSLFFEQNEYILMFFSITSAIFVGGAGSLIIGGLYWKKGSYWGAYAGLTTGCLMGIGSLVMRQLWPGAIYPWMVQSAPGLLEFSGSMLALISETVPGINWKLTPEEFPINSQWMFFFTIVFSIAAYVCGSLLQSAVKNIPAYDLEKLLHRGKYAVEGEHAGNVEKPATGFRAILPSKEFSKVDKGIYYGKIIWTLGWFAVFIAGTIINLTTSVNVDTWVHFWFWKVIITISIGAVMTVWLLWGGLRDLKALFVSLSEARKEEADSGMVTINKKPGAVNEPEGLKSVAVDISGERK